MKVLLDTNVLLSAAWRDRLPEKVVRHVATAPDIEWIATAEILKEYTDVLGRPKFQLPATILQEWVNLVAMRTLLIPSPAADPRLVRDPKDAIFLAAAVSAAADFLVTGENDLLAAKSSLTTRIVTVAEFAAEFSIV